MGAEFKKIAFIGLGQMGMPMAKNLVAAGFPVIATDLNPSAREAFKGFGRTADSTSEAVRDADCIVTILPNGKIVQAALVGEGRPIDGASDKAIVIEMSSSAPAETRELMTKIGGNRRLIDAPVSGGVKRALDASLATMVGGEAEDLEECRPVISAMCGKIFHCGPVGAGHAMKAINNYVSGAGVIAAIEAVQLGEAFGLDPASMVDVLNASSGKNNATEVKMKQFILNETFASGFGIGLMAKDIRIAQVLSESIGLEQENLRRVADIWEAASTSIGAQGDHTAIAKYLKKTEHN